MVVIMDSREGDAARARRATAAFLDQACPWADMDEVILVVSELVTNAIRHTDGWWRLQLQEVHGRLVVDINDASTAPPIARAPDMSGGGGLGWHIVHTLAASVEVVQQPGGKTVRATWLRPSLMAAAA